MSLLVVSFPDLLLTSLSLLVSLDLLSLLVNGLIFFSSSLFVFTNGFCDDLLSAFFAL